MKFDHIFSNPPYMKKGAKDFNELFLEKANKIVVLNTKASFHGLCNKFGIYYGGLFIGASVRVYIGVSGKKSRLVRDYKEEDHSKELIDYDIKKTLVFTVALSFRPYAEFKGASIGYRWNFLNDTTVDIRAQDKIVFDTEQEREASKDKIMSFEDLQERDRFVYEAVRGRFEVE